jgi:quinohemoprotein ethanol dehydrogenase
MSRNRLTVLAVTAAALVFTAASSSTHAASDKAVGAGNDWPAVRGASDESSYSRLDRINISDIGKLGLAWSLDLPGEVSLEATPLEVGGTIFFTGSEAKVYAVDAKTGEIKWTYENRGMAYENGKVFAAALDGRLFAFDAKTGKELWVAESIPSGMLNISSGAPR